MSALSTAGLLRAHLRSGLGAAALTATLVAVTVFVAAAVPSALAALTTAQLQHAASELSTARRDLTASGPLGPRFAELVTATNTIADITDQVEVFPRQYGEPLEGVLGAGEWVGVTRLFTANPQDPAPGAPSISVNLAIDPAWQQRVRIVEGSAPRAWSGTLGSRDEPHPPVPVAVSAGFVKNAGVALGDLLDYNGERLEVAAVYEPLDADAGYWAHAPLLGAPIVTPPPGYSVTASLYVDPGTVQGLSEWFNSASVTAWWPSRVGTVTAANASEIVRAFHDTQSYGRVVISQTELTLTSDLPHALEVASARMQFVLALLALVAAGPLGVVFAVDAQAAQAVLTRRRPALALASARGASGRQLRTAMAVEGLLIGLPAAGIAYLATRLLFPGDFTAAGLALAIVFGLAPAVLLAALTPTRLGRGERTDVSMRSRSGVRWVVEVAAVGLAALAVFLLFRRGFAEASAEVGIDPLLAAVPLLLAIAGCVIALRIYPTLLLLVHRLARTTARAVFLLGAARAVRTPALGFATGFSLLVGVSISVFSTGIATTIRAAIAQALLLPSADNEKFLSLTQQPVMTGLTVMLLLAAIVATLLGALAVVLGSIAASEPRNRLLGIARVLGFSPRQLGALVGWELAPLAIVAIAAGAVAGAAELQLVLGALDLRPFLGTTDAVAPVLDPLWVAGVIAVFTVVVLVAGFVTAAIARRMSPVSSIKMGAE